MSALANMQINIYYILDPPKEVCGQKYIQQRGRGEGERENDALTHTHTVRERKREGRDRCKVQAKLYLLTNIIFSYTETFLT